MDETRPPTQSRAARWFVGLCVLLGLAAILFLAWLPFDPLEEPAGRLDRMVPDTVDLAVRLDGRDALGSPFAQSVWSHPEVVALRERFEVEERVVAPLRAVEESVRRLVPALAGAEPPGLEADIIPAEVVCALRGREVLLVTRITGRARAFELVRRADPGNLAQHGLTIEGDFLRLRRTTRELWIARRSDALIVSTSRGLALEALVAAKQGGHGSLFARRDFDDALRLGRPAGNHAYLWADARSLARRLREGAGNDPLWSPWWLALLEHGPHPIRMEADLSESERLTVKASLPFDAEGRPPLLRALEGAASPDAAVIERDAARYAAPSEAMVAGGTTAHVAQVIEALLRSLPPEHQAVAEQALAQAGESVASVAKELSRHLGDGVGFVVARLPEADAIHRAEDEPGAVHAIPATTVIFRLRSQEGGAAVVEALRRRARLLFDAELGDRVETLPGGARLHVLDRHGLGGQWELLRPAFAIDGDRFLFSTHAGSLRRALEPRAVPQDALEGRTFAARTWARPLRKFVSDLRWEAADRATWHDWAAERRSLGAMDEDAADREMRRRVERRRTQEVPEAAEAWAARWRWLGIVGDGEVTGEFENGVLEVRARVELKR